MNLKRTPADIRVIFCFSYKSNTHFRVQRNHKENILIDSHRSLSSMIWWIRINSILCGSYAYSKTEFPSKMPHTYLYNIHALCALWLIQIVFGTSYRRDEQCECSPTQSAGISMKNTLWMAEPVPIYMYLLSTISTHHINVGSHCWDILEFNIVT